MESFGPLVVGARLHSSLSRDAFVAVVYTKGAVVLSTLARLLGEGVFVEIMGEVAAGASGRVLSTGELIAGIEGLADVDLEWFVCRYILGTGLAEIVHTCRVEGLADGGAQGPG